MEMDVAQLATDAAKFLAPFLPYLIAGGKAAAQEAGKKFGEAAWNKAEELWGKLKPKVEASPSAQKAIEKARSNEIEKREGKPDDPRVQMKLEVLLEGMLEEDDAFARFVKAGDYSVVIGGNVENSNIISNSDNSRIIHAETYIEGNVYKGAAPRNSQEALKIYRRVVAQTTSSLPLRGVDLGASDPTTAQKPIGLANVYVALDTRTQVEVKEEEQKRKQPALLDLDRERPLPALEAVIQNRRLVLKGDPGGGKSTFVSYLAHCLASQNVAQLNDWPEAESELVPLLVILRDFARSVPKNLPNPEPQHLWNFITARLKAQNLASAAKPIHELMEQGKIILLLDGLDEVPTIEQRIFIRDAVNAFVQRYPENRFLITCRVLSYQPPKSKRDPDLRLAAVPEFELAAFDSKKIASFVKHWYDELASLGIVSVEEAPRLTERLQNAIQRPELKRLAPNPLLLTVMALVHTHKGRLPDARALLYEDTIDILLWRWEQVSKGQTSRLSQLLLNASCTDIDLKRVLWKIAFEAHSQTNMDDDGEQLAGIRESSLEQALAALNKDDRNWAMQVIETMKMRAGLLLERDMGIFTFPHRSFQEYLAGAYLTSEEDFTAHAVKLVENGSIWREVILWGIGRLVYFSGDIHRPLALAGELCPSTNPQDYLEWTKIWLAGDILLETGLNRVQDSALGRDLLPRVRERLADLLTEGKLNHRERASAGDTLARLSDPRPGVINDFLFCEIPAGVFQMGEGNEQLRYDKIKSSYFMSRYPITNAQFDVFVQADGYKTEPYWNEAKQAGWWSRNGFKGRYDNEVRIAPVNFNAPFNLPNHPVVGVSWYEALAFCRWLTGQFQVPGFKFQVHDPKTGLIRDEGNWKWEVRLPTEAEWERAARGGKSFHYPWGDEITPNHANYSDTGIGTTSAVGCFPLGTNGFGLLDMSGNVWEWCVTKWVDSYKNYGAIEDNDPEGDSARVLRGGAFYNAIWPARCASRYSRNPHFRYHFIGYRVVVASSPISLVTRSGS